MNALHTRTQADGKEEKTRGQVARVNTNIFDAPLIIINIAPRREKEKWGGEWASSSHHSKLTVTTTRLSTNVNTQTYVIFLFWFFFFFFFSKKEKRTGSFGEKTHEKKKPRWKRYENITKYDIGQNASKQSKPPNQKIRKKKKRKKIKVEFWNLPGAWRVEVPHATAELWRDSRLGQWPTSTLWHAVPSIIIGRSSHGQKKKPKKAKR